MLIFILFRRNCTVELQKNIGLTIFMVQVWKKMAADNIIHNFSKFLKCIKVKKGGNFPGAWWPFSAQFLSENNLRIF